MKKRKMKKVDHLQLDFRQIVSDFSIYKPSKNGKNEPPPPNRRAIKKIERNFPCELFLLEDFSKFVRFF